MKTRLKNYFIDNGRDYVFGSGVVSLERKLIQYKLKVLVFVKAKIIYAFYNKKAQKYLSGFYTEDESPNGTDYVEVNIYGDMNPYPGTGKFDRGNKFFSLIARKN
jgi:hypothetical protein